MKNNKKKNLEFEENNQQQDVEIFLFISICFLLVYVDR